MYLSVGRVTDHLFQYRHLLLEHEHFVLVHTGMVVGHQERSTGGGGEGGTDEDTSHQYHRAHLGHLSSSEICLRRAATNCMTMTYASRMT